MVELLDKKDRERFLKILKMMKGIKLTIYIQTEYMMLIKDITKSMIFQLILLKLKNLE